MKPKHFLACALLALPVLGQPVQVHLDSPATKVNFTLGDVLHTVHGTFKLKRGDLWFDATSGKAGGQLIVDATSGDSGSGARDSRMHKNILESAKFPEITFVPDRVDGIVSLSGDSNVRLHGAFTIHGGTHEMTMSVKSHLDTQKISATIDFAVPYVSWGMKNPSTFFLRVDDHVDIHIEAAGQVAGR